MSGLMLFIAGIHCYYSLVKAMKASVTFHGKDNVPLLVFQRGLLFVWNLAIEQ